MYKITNVTDTQGYQKIMFMDELQKVHPKMCGELLYPLSSANRLCLIWADRSDKMLRTSNIKKYKEENGVLTVETQNSIYTLERVK